MLQTFTANTNAVSKRVFLCILAAAITLFAAPRIQAADKQDDEDTLGKANVVLSSMLSGGTIPADVLAKTKCIVILPGVKKFGFGVGGSGGRGPMLCRGAKPSLADGPHQP
jgi:lipid-binding SYLF domain-containing protein